MATAVKNASYYAIGSVVRSVTSFVLLPIFSNALGAEQYGVLNLLQTLSTILGVLMTLATERSLFRLYYDYKTAEEKKWFLSTVFWTINGISAIMIILTILSGKYIAHFVGDVDVWHVLLPTVSYTYFMALINYSQVLMQVEQKGKDYFKVSILLLIIYNVVSLIFLYCYSRNVEALVYGQLIASVIVIPFAIGNVKNRISFVYSVNILRSTLKYSIPIFIAVSFSWMLNMTDRLFIANLATLQDAGVYSLASKFTQFAVLLVGAVHQAYSPFFYNISNTNTYEEAKRRLLPANKAITLITCATCVIIAIFIKPLLFFLFNPEYYSSIIYVYILALSALFTQQCGLLNVMVYQNKKVKSMAAITIICGILSLTLNYFLIPVWGAIASAISNLIVGVTVFSLTFILAKKNYYIPLCFSIMGCSLLILVIGGVIDLCTDNVYFNLLFKVLLLFISVGIVYSLRIITAKEYLVFRNKISSIFE